MNKKKVFVSPRVIQEVQVQLEKDLLGDSVLRSTTITSIGQGEATYTFSNDPADEEASYFAEW